MKNKKGISLIVLVITIIVMIILATAIILSLNSSGIIGKANKAKADSDIATKKQAASVLLAEYELKARTGENVDGKDANDYVRDGLDAQGIDPNNVVVDEDGNVLVGSGANAIIKGVKIGDYVDYVPTVATSTFNTFDDEEGAESDAFTTETTLRWRYMGVDKNGKALLVADTSTSDYYYLEGAEGYLNGSTNLNTICKEIYSGKLGEARSINVEDVNKALGANPVGTYYSGLEGKLVENPLGLTIGEIVSKKGEPALEHTYTPDEGGDINKYVSDYYDYTGTAYKDTDDIEYQLVFGEEDMYYWLASSCVWANFGNGNAGFDVRYVDGGGVYGYTLVNSHGGGVYGDFYAVRPVVSLNSDVLFGTKIDGVWSIS